MRPVDHAFHAFVNLLECVYLLEMLHITLKLLLSSVKIIFMLLWMVDLLVISFHMDLGLEDDSSLWVMSLMLRKRQFVYTEAGLAEFFIIACFQVF